MNEGKIIQFIKDSTSQKEISLMVARDNEEFQVLHNFLTQHGYKNSYDPLEILEAREEHKKVCLIFNHDNGKSIYDFVLQYPTGQISAYDGRKKENLSLVPTYEDHSIILLTTEKYLSHLEKTNFNFLNIIGMVFRSED